MLAYFFSTLKELFTSPSYHDNLEAYITAGNPQDSHDVERLEREFYEIVEDNH